MKLIKWFRKTFLGEQEPQFSEHMTQQDTAASDKVIILNPTPPAPPVTPAPPPEIVEIPIAKKKKPAKKKK